MLVIHNNIDKLNRYNIKAYKTIRSIEKQNKIPLIQRQSQNK